MSLSREAVIWVCLLSVIVSFPRVCSLCFCSHLAEETRASYFTLLYLCSDRCDVCWSVDCNCGDYRAYSLAICSHLAEEERAGYFTFIKLQLSFDGLRSVFLPRCDVCSSVVCDCGIYRSYSLAF